LLNNEFLPNYTVRQMHGKMVKSGLIFGRAGYENLARFWPQPDLISGATLIYRLAIIS